MAELWPGRRGPLIKYISPSPQKWWQKESPRSLVILGSTGSIGCNALSVVDACQGSFLVLGLSCARNVQKLAEQASKYKPPYLAVLDKNAATELKQLLPTGYKPHILEGEAGYVELATLSEASTVLSAQSGAAGLHGTLAAVLTGKVICLANKESLALAGGLVREICRLTNASILPVDSEHNALFQCLAGRGQEIEQLLLTASGGPFRQKNKEQLEHVTAEEALQHPNWKMGKKISIDSATMMNKGLEVIEAFHLYGIEPERIRVLVHPQSVVHSLVRFKDGSMLAQMGQTDMRLPLSYCLCWPNICSNELTALDLTEIETLSFYKPDLESFPCLKLALDALASKDDGLCVVLNAANEVAVELFLNSACTLTDIPLLIQDSMSFYLKERADQPPLQFAIGQRNLSDTEAIIKTVHDTILQIQQIDAKTRAFVQELAAQNGVKAC